MKAHSVDTEEALEDLQKQVSENEPKVPENSVGTIWNMHGSQRQRPDWGRGGTKQGLLQDKALS